MEHDLGHGYTIVIEWAERWNRYAGTIIHPKGYTSGTILRETEQAVYEAGLQTVDRKEG